jgi:excisionase family DNA binding protein
MKPLKKQTAPMMMTRNEVAAQLQVSTKTVDNLWREGKLPRPSRIGRGVRFIRRDIMQFITDSEMVPKIVKDKT